LVEEGEKGEEELMRVGKRRVSECRYLIMGISLVLGSWQVDFRMIVALKN